MNKVNALLQLHLCNQQQYPVVSLEVFKYLITAQLLLPSALLLRHFPAVAGTATAAQSAQVRYG
jgi:hypothetical protein